MGGRRTRQAPQEAHALTLAPEVCYPTWERALPSPLVEGLEARGSPGSPGWPGLSERRESSSDDGGEEDARTWLRAKERGLRPEAGDAGPGFFPFVCVQPLNLRECVRAGSSCKCCSGSSDNCCTQTRCQRGRKAWVLRPTSLQDWNKPKEEGRLQSCSAASPSEEEGGAM